jgi:hypothetical protein
VFGIAPPSAAGVALSVTGGIVALVAGSIVFARFERRLADVI